MTQDSTLAVTNTCPKDGVHLYHRELRSRSFLMWDAVTIAA